MVRTLAGKELETLADVLERIGNVPAHRVLLDPRPGTATEKDLLEVSTTTDRLYELVHGTLVEKTTGWREGRLAADLIVLLGGFVRERNLGVVAGPDGMIRFKLDLVRMPDVSFVSWDKVEDPAELEDPGGAYLEVAPDLAVEVLSENNTAKEMAIKLGEYAGAGVRLVWYVDPDRTEVTVYPRGKERGKKVVGLGGGDVLPGFTLPVAKIFEKRSPAKKGGRKGKPGRG